MVPTAVAVFPTDCSVRRFADKPNNVVHWSEFGRGGHFAALEAPDLLTADVRSSSAPWTTPARRGAPCTTRPTGGCGGLMALPSSMPHPPVTGAPAPGAGVVNGLNGTGEARDGRHGPLARVHQPAA